MSHNDPITNIPTEDVSLKGEIDAVVAAHLIKTHSTTWGSTNYHHAGCTCDPALEFDWYERDEQHRSHVLAAVFAAGRASVIPPATSEDDQ